MRERRTGPMLAFFALGDRAPARGPATLATRAPPRTYGDLVKVVREHKSKKTEEWKGERNKVVDALFKEQGHRVNHVKGDNVAKKARLVYDSIVRACDNEDNLKNGVCLATLGDIFDRLMHLAGNLLENQTTVPDVQRAGLGLFVLFLRSRVDATGRDFKKLLETVRARQKDAIATKGLNDKDIQSFAWKTEKRSKSARVRFATDDPVPQELDRASTEWATRLYNLGTLPTYERLRLDEKGKEGNDFGVEFGELIELMSTHIHALLDFVDVLSKLSKDEPFLAELGTMRNDLLKLDYVKESASELFDVGTAETPSLLQVKRSRKEQIASLRATIARSETAEQMRLETEAFTRHLHDDDDVADGLQVQIFKLLSEDSYDDDWRTRFDNVLIEIKADYRDVVRAMAVDKKRSNREVAPEEGSQLKFYTGRVKTQPGDGSCLFHSIAATAGLKGSGHELRQRTVEYMRKNGKNVEISGKNIEEWIRWDDGYDVERYYTAMQGKAWGGGIEMAAMAAMLDLSIHVYETANTNDSRFRMRRISTFGDGKKEVDVLYVGEAHYDALFGVVEA